MLGEILNLAFIFLLCFLILYILNGFLKVIISNGGFTNHTLSIAITQAAFKFSAKLPKAVKKHQNSVKIILVALELEITKGVLQEYSDSKFF